MRSSAINGKEETMQPLPHHYDVTVTAREVVSAEITSRGLPDMPSAPPSEFGGPGNMWSPETLLVADVADCFVFTFRAIAKASKFEWTQLVCNGTGTVDRSDRLTRFTALQLHARLRLPTGSDMELAAR